MKDMCKHVYVALPPSGAVVPSGYYNQQQQASSMSSRALPSYSTLPSRSRKPSYVTGGEEGRDACRTGFVVKDRAGDGGASIASMMMMMK